MAHFAPILLLVLLTFLVVLCMEILFFIGHLSVNHLKGFYILNVRHEIHWTTIHSDTFSWVYNRRIFQSLHSAVRGCLRQYWLSLFTIYNILLLFRLHFSDAKLKGKTDRQRERGEGERERGMCVGLAAAGTHKSPASAKAPAPMCRN